MTFENDWCYIYTIVAYYDYLTITILDLKLICPENIINDKYALLHAIYGRVLILMKTIICLVHCECYYSTYICKYDFR